MLRLVRSRCPLIVALVLLLGVPMVDAQSGPTSFSTTSPIRWWSAVETNRMDRRWDPIAANSASIYVAGRTSVADKTTLTAFGRETGVQSWSKQLTRASVIPINGFPVIMVTANENVVALVDHFDLFVFDAATGSQLWTFSTEFPMPLSAATLSETTLFVNELDDPNSTTHYRAFDIRTGTTLPNWSATSGPVNVFAVPLADDKLFVADILGTVKALDTATGAEIWRVTGGVSVAEMPVIISNAVLITSSTAANDQVIAFNPDTGTQLWARPDSQLVAASDDLVLLTSSAGANLTTAINPVTNTDLWTIGEGIAKAAIGDAIYGVVQTASNAGELIALSLTGGELWRHTTQGMVDPYIAGDSVLTDDGSQFTLLDSANGSVHYTFGASDHEAWLEPLSDTHFAIHSWDGSVSELDTSQRGVSLASGSVSDPGVTMLAAGELIPVPPKEQTLSLWRVKLAPGASTTFPDLGASMLAFPSSGSLAIGAGATAITAPSAAESPPVQWPTGSQTVTNSGASNAEFYLAGITDEATADNLVALGLAGVTLLSAASTVESPITSARVQLGRIDVPAATAVTPVLSFWPVGTSQVDATTASDALAAGEISTVENPAAATAEMLRLTLTPGSVDGSEPPGCNGRCM